MSETPEGDIETPAADDSRQMGFRIGERLPILDQVLYSIILVCLSFLVIIQVITAMQLRERTEAVLCGMSYGDEARWARASQSGGSGAGSSSDGAETESEPGARGIERTYVGSGTCRNCHEKEYGEWMGSDHQLGMQKADRHSIGDDHFVGEVFEGRSSISKFHREGEQFTIDETDKSGKMQSYPVAFVFGLHPLQQLVVPFPGGRFQMYTIAWDTGKKEWFDLYPDEVIGEEDELNWKRFNFTWNLMCVECHTTNLEKGYDETLNSYRTTFSEIGVSCESCHGPGSRHVALAADELKEWGRDFGKGLSVVFPEDERKGTTNGASTNRVEIDVCAECHSRRRRIAKGYEPGQRFTEYFAPEYFENDLYFADGQIKDEVFVYGSFLQSRMYGENVKCTDCHNPHSDRLKLTGNALCVQCHALEDFDTPVHFHHEVGREGSQCVECHMPTRDYMVVDPRRDHSMQVPRPDLSVKYGVPNACNQCHVKDEEDSAWAALRIAEWLGEARADEPHFADAFVEARGDQIDSIPLLRQVIETEKGYGPIVRGTAAELLGGFADRSEVSQVLKKALHDRDALVRAGAVRGVAGATASEQIRLLSPIAAGDRSRLVRIEAARILAKYPDERIDKKYWSGVDKAIGEYLESLLVNADSPGAQLNLGVFYRDRRKMEEAARAYERALVIESNFVPALVNLALLRYDDGKRDEAERLLRRATAARPDFIDGYFMLGILLAEEPKKVLEAISVLSKGAELAPDRSDIQYNLGLSFRMNGDLDKAKSYLRKAVGLSPDSSDYHYALVTVLIDRGDWDEALEEVDQLERLVPDDPSRERLRAYIEARR